MIASVCCIEKCAVLWATLYIIGQLTGINTARVRESVASVAATADTTRSCFSWLQWALSNDRMVRLSSDSTRSDIDQRQLNINTGGRRLNLICMDIGEHRQAGHAELRRQRSYRWSSLCRRAIRDASHVSYHKSYDILSVSPARPPAHLTQV